MLKSFLKDDFYLSGKSEDDFRKNLADMVEATTCIQTDLSVLDRLYKKEETKDAVKVFMMNENFDMEHFMSSISGISSTIKKIKSGECSVDDLQAVIGAASTGAVRSIKKSSISSALEYAENLLDETSEWLYNGVNKQMYFLSDNAISDVNARTGMKGSSVSSCSLERAVAQKSFCNHKTVPVNLIVRTDNNIRKIFAVTSGAYQYVPDTILLDMLDKISDYYDLGDWEVERWELTHNISRVVVSFPSIAKDISDVYGVKLTPCLMLSTSSTGRSSIYCRSIWKVSDHSFFIEDEVATEHRGEVNVEEFLEESAKTIFKDYFAVPEALCNAMSIDISDPKWSQKNFHNNNKKKVEEIVSGLFKELNIVGCISKKNEVALRESVLALFDYNLPLTMYDILEVILKTPERLKGLNPLQMEKYQKAITKSLFLDYSKLGTKKQLKLAI